MWFRTPQVMKGYLNRPDATAEVITEDGWFRTGDIGRVDEDGFIFVEDRLKDMIISGGENIYSIEVERVLGEHPAVTEVAVIGVPDEKWGEAVKAVVALEGPMPAEEELIAWCRERLAGYKCPKTVDITDALPRNPTGKILKKDLRKPYWEGRDRATVERRDADARRHPGPPARRRAADAGAVPRHHGSRGGADRRARWLGRVRRVS